MFSLNTQIQFQVITSQTISHLRCTLCNHMKCNLRRKQLATNWNRYFNRLAKTFETENRITKKNAWQINSEYFHSAGKIVLIAMSLKTMSLSNFILVFPWTFYLIMFSIFGIPWMLRKQHLSVMSINLRFPYGYSSLIQSSSCFGKFVQTKTCAFMRIISIPFWYRKKSMEIPIREIHR